MHLPNYIYSFNILTFLIVSLPLFFFSLTLVFNSFPTALCECKEIQAKKHKRLTGKFLSLTSSLVVITLKHIPYTQACYCHIIGTHALQTSLSLSWHCSTSLLQRSFLVKHWSTSLHTSPSLSWHQSTFFAYRPFLCHGTRAHPFCTRLSLSDTAAHPCIQALPCHDTVAHPLLSSLYCHALVHITYTHVFLC